MVHIAGAITSSVVNRRGFLPAPKEKSDANLSCRESSMATIDKELESLKQLFKRACEQKRSTLAESCVILRQRLVNPPIAKWHRRQEGERGHGRSSAFITNSLGSPWAEETYRKPH